MPIRILAGLFVSLLISLSAHAQDIGLQNIDETDFKDIVSDFSANSLHTSVSGAGTLGDIFGFELGLIAGLTNTPQIDKLAREVSSNNDAERIPHAELIGILTVPFAITVEAGFVPKVGTDEFKYSNLSLAAKWTPSALFFELPVDLAVKAQMTTVNVEFESVVSSTNTKYEFENKLMGVTGLVSKDFGVAAPYVGLGMVNAEGDLTANGAAVFDPSYTASASASEKVSSSVFIAGSEFKLVVLKLGIEYARLFDTDRYTGKLSFYF